MEPDEPSTDTEREFAAAVLEALLHRIEVGNANPVAYPRPGRCTFRVSHAWTDGAALRLVYRAPPSDRIWGLARDTRSSLINPSPWNANDDPALYYYLLDLQENWPGRSMREPLEDADKVWWSGDRSADLPGRVALIPDAYRYMSPPPDPSWIDHESPVFTEPRRYADPRDLR